MQKKLSKKKFKEEYTRWIRSASRDIAFAYDRLKAHDRKNIILQSEAYLKEPESVYGIGCLDEAKDLVPSNIILLSTDAVVFSQSIFIPMPGIFDYAVALNRRYYLGSWYSIITLNRRYLKTSTPAMLRFTLEHEMLQKEVYEENLRNGARKFTPMEKRKISNETLNKAIEKSGITNEELIREKELMLNISSISPLIPKPFAETALYWYMEKNLPEFKGFSEASKTKEEDRIGKKLNADFKGWIDFSTKIYKIFLTDIKKELSYTDQGYA
ncbi:MAG: hypothetical protein J5U17_03450 [Candidatus Methanoperedens sp.]|nr:hypothetical protein [Candidatus Methanoperedens sp.]MCE8429501.1 hypothetical protein [Candidatus Methanoperedens sp.]